MQEVREALREFKNPEKAKIMQGFFKTGKGQYGEGDVFLGLTVPQQRTIAKQFSDISLDDIHELLDSEIHEERLTALLILVNQYENGSEDEKKKIYDFYFKNASRVNNWDLVDLTAPNIVGKYLLDKKRDVLIELARSKNLWEKRIAIVATWTFIRNNEFEETLHITQILLDDKHDLLHKACGWMLREVGKKDVRVLRGFLEQYVTLMPRTMLRYSIERLPEEERKGWLHRK